MSVDGLLAALAVACFAATAGLGAFVQGRPLTPLDRAAAALRGRGTRPAIVCTRAGYWQALVGANVVVFGALLFTGDVPLFAFALAGVQLLSQGAVEAVKALYHRPRPDDWLFHREFGHSFPSGHATTAVTFYGGIVLIVWMSPLPLPAAIALTLLLAAGIVGIPWSRVALAAHYPTDVLGGLLFGAGWLCVLDVLLRQLPAVRILG